MTQSSFYSMFVDLLRDLYDAENQIIDYLPKVIQVIAHLDLKEALSQNLEESKTQLDRLKTIFKLLNENPTGKICKALQGLLSDIDQAIALEGTPAVKDAYLIICCQKIAHYEIASYGSARSIARHLQDVGLNNRVDFDEIADMLQQSLDEECAADEKLTDIAEGGFFTQGINDEAEEQTVQALKTTSNTQNKKSDL